MAVRSLADVPDNFKDAHINAASYQALYERSLNDPDGFWSEMASTFLSWANLGMKYDGSILLRVKLLGSVAAGSTSVSTALIATCLNAPTKQLSSGKETTPRKANTSATVSYMSKSVDCPMCSSHAGLKKATACAFTCP